MSTSLETILAFSHPGVIGRYRREFPADAHRADSVFRDLMAFFWVSKKHEHDRLGDPQDPQLDFVFIMDTEMMEIDKMWHLFLLYTQDYADFCERFFGEFLHHLPDVVPERKIREFDVEENLTLFLSYVFDHLGEEFVRKWFRHSLETV